MGCRVISTAEYREKYTHKYLFDLSDEKSHRAFRAAWPVLVGLLEDAKLSRVESRCIQPLENGKTYARVTIDHIPDIEVDLSGIEEYKVR